MKKSGKSKGKREGKEKNQSKKPCGNCKRTNHVTPDCYCKGRAKEGQGLRQKMLQLQNIFSYKPVLVFGTEQMAIFNSRESKF